MKHPSPLVDKSIFERIALLVVILGLLVWFIPLSKAGGDFKIYMEAAAKLAVSQDPYAPPFAHGLGYSYGLIFAAMLVPFAQFPEVTAYLWLVLQVACLARSWGILEKWLTKSSPDSKRIARLALILSMIWMSRFLVYNFRMVQVTPFLLWVTLEAWHQANNERGRWAYGALAFGMATKILPILLLPGWLAKARWKPVLWTAAFVAAWMALPCLFWGWEQVLEWNLSWWEVINPSQSQFVVNTETNAQTIAGILSALSEENVGLLTQDSVGIASQALRLAVLFAVLFRLWQNRRNFNDENYPRQWVREVGIICITIPLLFPHQQKYAFLFAFPAIVYLVLWLLERDWKTTNQSTSSYLWVVCVGFGLMTFSPLLGSDIIGRETYTMLLNAKILGLGTLMLLICLLFDVGSRLDRRRLPN